MRQPRRRRHPLVFFAAVLLLTSGLASALQEPPPHPIPEGPPGDKERDTQQDFPAPLPQRPVQGLRGVQVNTQLIPSDDADHPLNLSFLHIFPDRSRLEGQSPSGSTLSLHRTLRFGAKVWEIDGRRPAPRALEGDRHTDTLLRLELRRALFLWPKGFEWMTTEDGAKAEVKLSLAANVERPLGSLVAQLNAQGRPRRLAALRVDGREVLALLPEEWSAAGQPTSLGVEVDGRIIGRERVLRVHTDIFYNDDYFVPPKRLSGAAVVPASRWRTMELAAATIKRLPLSADSDWKTARLLRGRWFREESERLRATSHRLDPRQWFEVDWKGQPTAVLLRLQEVAVEAPGDWVTLRERPGLGLVLQRREHLDAARLEALRKGVPARAEAGRPYVVFLDQGPFQAQVFVSYTVPK